MPGRFVIHEPRSIVLSRSWGIVTGAELLARAVALRSDPLYRPTLSELTDFTRATGAEVTANQLRHLAQVSTFASGARRAICVGNSLGFGLSRMFEAFRPETAEAVHVFRDLDAALEWLGLTEHKAELMHVADGLEQDAPEGAR